MLCLPCLPCKMPCRKHTHGDRLLNRRSACIPWDIRIPQSHKSVHSCNESKKTFCSFKSNYWTRNTPHPLNVCPPVTITLCSLQKSDVLTPLYTMNTVWSVSSRCMDSPVGPRSWDSMWLLPIVWPKKSNAIGPYFWIANDEVQSEIADWWIKYAVINLSKIIQWCDNYYRSLCFSFYLLF